MTDDFQLFPDQAGGEAVDADIALITAYLARELSLVQIAAVEDRLASDRAFRDKVGPILQAWTQSAARQVPRAGAGALSRDEVEAGWQRYVGDHAELDAHEGPRLMVEGEQPKRRKIRMTRIAAGIAAITLPIVTLAQVVIYASKNPETPGHTVARDIVRPFTEAPPAPPIKAPEQTLPSPVDVRIGKELEKQTPEVQRAAPAQIPAAQTPGVTVNQQPVIPIYSANPDRAKIAALMNKHMPEVVRGDTAATYAVVVMDAKDNYVWGTYGTGNLQIVIGGDKRTPAERAEFTRTNSLEYTGAIVRGASPAALVGAGVGGRGGASGGSVRAAAGGGGGGAGIRSRDTVRQRVDTGVIAVNDSVRRGILGSRVLQLDTASTARRDTSGWMRAVAGGGGGGGRGGALAPSSPQSAFVAGLDSTAYVLGFGRVMNGQLEDLNQAAGLQEPGKGESGIQGLKATSLTMGESYFYSAGQLGKQTLRVVVVHLAPGTAWKGR